VMLAGYERSHYELIDSFLEEITRFRMQTWKNWKAQDSKCLPNSRQKGPYENNWLDIKSLERSLQPPKKYFHPARLRLINTEVVFGDRGECMEEIFKGLIERAQYYEQFESYRNQTPQDILGMRLSLI
jgi:hypothetical protein